MRTSIKRAVALAFVSFCLVNLHGQGVIQLNGLEGRGKGIRLAFEQRYPPDRTYAVVVRGDLPTIVKGSRESSYPVEIGDSDWKGPGSMFRAKTVGNLAPGEVMKVERVDYSGDHVELRLVSVDPHEIVVDAKRPERNRREQVVTLLIVPHDAGLLQLVQRLDAYVRLFPDLEAARAYARGLHDPLPDRRFTLGVMRRDGILVPIASYDEGHWYRRWPLPAAEREVPIGMNDLPTDWWGVEGRTAKWTLWTLDGMSRPVEALGPLAFGAHCLMNVGLRTNYRSMLPAPPLDQQHYPKDGIATTGSLPIERVTVETAQGPYWDEFERLVTPQVRRLEAPQMFRIPIAALQGRPPTSVKLEVLCWTTGRIPNSVIAYFEASRKYPPPDETIANPCGVVTFAQGWVHRLASGAGVLDSTTRAQVTDCSMWDVEFRTPLGVLRVGGGDPIWIMEVSRWGGERYELVQVSDTAISVLLSVPGGACRTIGR